MNSIRAQTGTHRPDVRGGPALPARAAVRLIQLYQMAVSPWLGRRCRFHPTCSNYCIEALRQHGMVHGLWLGLKRIGKCHPFHSGGYDPVPGRKTKMICTTTDTQPKAP